MAVAVLASATMANADTFVWYSTANTNGNGGAGPAGGAQGSALNLTCDTSGAPNGSCNWVIQMRANLGAGGITGWSADLGTAAGNGVSVSAPTIPAAPFDNGANPGAIGTGPTLLVGSRAQTFTPVGPQTLTLMTFNLTRAWTSPNATLAVVNGGPSTNGQIVWGNDTAGDYENVGFGALPATPAFEGTGAAPVINVQNIVPEPASLGLLALGALAVVRRRVAR